MRTKILSVWVLLTFAYCLAARSAGAAAEPSLQGSWVTDTVVVAKQMQERLKEALQSGDLEEIDDEGAVARAYRNRVAANPGLAQNSNRNVSTNRTGGGSVGGGSRGTVAPGGGGGGMRSGGGGGGGFGGGGGGARGGRGNNFLPSSRQEEKPAAAQGKTVSGKNMLVSAEAPDDLTGPAVTMELKVSKNKLTGNITEISPDDLSDLKTKVEDGEINGARFKFVTYRKANNVQLPIRWDGEMVNEKTVRLTRKMTSGKNVDQVDTVTFTRVK